MAPRTAALQKPLRFHSNRVATQRIYALNCRQNFRPLDSSIDVLAKCGNSVSNSRKWTGNATAQNGVVVGNDSNSLKFSTILFNRRQNMRQSVARTLLCRVLNLNSHQRLRFSFKFAKQVAGISTYKMATICQYLYEVLIENEYHNYGTVNLSTDLMILI